jgi:hypothetical protein
MDTRTSTHGHGGSSPTFLYKIREVDLKVKKVKLSLCLTKHHAMKAYRGVEV